MGLKANGEKGAKFVLMRRYANAFRPFDNLSKLRDGLGTKREHVVSVLDGNVAFMQVPQAVDDFQGYVNIIYNAIYAAMSAAVVVIVVFDEPENMTEAKKEEQSKRDARRTNTVPAYSNDLGEILIRDDRYTREQLENAKDCHNIIAHRPARQRFFDGVIAAVMVKIRRSIDEWRRGGHAAAVFFDGIDVRGAERSIGDKRIPTLFGTDDAIGNFLQHAPEGEGDLKLAVVEQRVRDAAVSAEAPPVLKQIQFVFGVTIDTDSLAIGLLEAARRNCEHEPGDARHACRAVLCMRERGSQKRDNVGTNVAPHYNCVDQLKLHDLVQKDMWGGIKARPSDKRLEREAVTLFVAGLICCGSDYCEIKGLNADAIVQTIGPMIRNNERVRSAMSAAWAGDAQAVALLRTHLATLIHATACVMKDIPRIRKKTIEALQTPDKEQILRAVWNLSYWSRNELKEGLDEFGFRIAGPIMQSDDF